MIYIFELIVEEILFNAHISFPGVSEFFIRRFLLVHVAHRGPNNDVAVTASFLIAKQLVHRVFGPQLLRPIEILILGDEIVQQIERVDNISALIVQYLLDHSFFLVDS